MKSLLKTVSAVALITGAVAANAATVNPGSWTRGDAGSVYAEWDAIAHEGGAGVLDTTPDIGSFNTALTQLTAAPGNIVSGSANIYTFNTTGPFEILVNSDANGTNASGTVEAYLQISAWGELNTASVVLNGAAHDSFAVVETPNVPTSFGPVTQYDYTFSWLLNPGAANLDFDFSTDSIHTSVTNFAIDASVSAVPVPAAAWLFGSALLGLAGVGRNRKG